MFRSGSPPTPERPPAPDRPLSSRNPSPPDYSAKEREQHTHSSPTRERREQAHVVQGRAKGSALARARVKRLRRRTGRSPPPSALASRAWRSQGSGLCRPGDPPPAGPPWPLLPRSRRRAGFQARSSRDCNPCPKEADTTVKCTQALAAADAAATVTPPVLRTAPAVDPDPRSPKARRRSRRRPVTTPIGLLRNRRRQVRKLAARPLGARGFAVGAA